MSDPYSPPNENFIAESDGPLLKIMRDRYSTVPWNRLRKWISAGQVCIDGQVCHDGAISVYKGVTISVSPKSSGSATTLLKRNTFESIRILALNRDYVVIDKPSGIISQIRPAVGEEEVEELSQGDPTLEDILPLLIRKKCANHPELKSGAPRLVHRLDKETSGVMVFARSGSAYTSLKEQFFEHTIDREYCAIVQGEFGRARTFDSYLVRNRGDGIRGSISRAVPGAKRAITHVKPVAHFRGGSIVVCRLETGRTHQIRIHLSQAGHPLFGDWLYGDSRRDRTAYDAPRLGLHAYQLGFEFPEGERVNFQSAIPDDLAEWLQQFGVHDISKLLQ